MEHTIGKWHAHDGQIYPEETGKTICLIPHYDKTNKEQQANARLLKAAPALLAALKNLLEVDLLRDEYHIAGRQAIADAS